MKSKATLKQIANDLGVSVSTVSKALSNSPEISEPTKLRIKEYAQLQNYMPNMLAKNLKNQRSNTIGVIVPNILNPFFAKVFSGIEHFANANGYNVITYISNESLAKEKQAMELLRYGTVDGFILSLAEETQKKQEFSHFKETMQQGLPIVMFDRIADELLCDKVVVDDYESSIHAVTHLLSIGCKKIAFFSCIGNLSVGKLRAKGYQDALQKAGISSDPNLILIREHSTDFDTALTCFWQSDIDAVFAADEHSATTVMKWAYQQGIKIPEDLCVIGFADGIWSRRLTPSLSTISQHGPEIGAIAAQLLIEKLESKEEIKTYQTKVVKTELRQRDSTQRK